MNRRNLLKTLAGGVVVGSLDLNAVDVIRKPTAKNVIYLFLKGGISHVDSFDPKDTVGKLSKVINTNVDGIHLSHHFPMLAAQADKFTIVRSMKTSQGAHEPGDYYLHCSYTKRGTIVHPCLGSWVSKMSGKENPDLPGNVVICGGSNGHGAGFMSSKFQPLSIPNPFQGLSNSRLLKGMSQSEFEGMRSLSKFIDSDFKKSNEQLKAFDDMEKEALSLMGDKTQKIFDLSEEPQKLKTSYGKDEFAQGCLLARRLVENGVRFVEVVSKGWDDHNDLYGYFPGRANALDRAISTLINDLEVRGLLDETLVVVATEFGRGPVLNQNQGRDHWPRAFSCILAGGGIKGGCVYGKTDKAGHSIIESPVTIEDFNATIAYSLGIDTEEIIMSPTQRPFKIANEGNPVFDLFKGV